LILDHSPHRVASGSRNSVFLALWVCRDEKNDAEFLEIGIASSMRATLAAGSGSWTESNLPDASGSFDDRVHFRVSHDEYLQRKEIVIGQAALLPRSREDL
jgi:hypothetical protein